MANPRKLVPPTIVPPTSPIPVPLKVPLALVIGSTFGPESKIIGTVLLFVDQPTEIEYYKKHVIVKRDNGHGFLVCIVRGKPFGA